MTTPDGQPGRVPARADDAWAARLVDALPHPWLWVTADGRLVRCSGAWERYGAAPAAHIGRPLTGALPPALGAALAALLPGPAVGRERHPLAVRIGAGERQLVVTVSATGGGEVAMFVRDDTEHAEIERRVADSERPFRAVAGIADEGIWVLDHEHRTTFMSPRTAALIGYAPDEVVGRSPLEFVDAESQAALASRLARRRAGVTERGALLLRHRDGERIPVTIVATPISDDDGRYLGAVAMLADDRAATRRERELRESQRHLGAIAEVHDDVYYVAEVLPDGTCSSLFTGPGTDRLLGGEPPAGPEAASAWNAAVHPDHRQTYEAMNAALLRGEPVDDEYVLVGQDGVERWVHDRARPRPVGPDGRCIFDGMLSDVSERHAQTAALEAALAEATAANDALLRAHAELEHAHREAAAQARTDALTGTANRRAFGEAIAQELARSDRSGRGVGVVLLDVDHFKRVNDTHGHEIGDEVLTVVADRLRGVIRTYDTLARWGGEEFVVLIADLPDGEPLRRIAQGLVDAVALVPVETSAGPLQVTISAGAAHRICGQTAKHVIDAADHALYAAKRRGRNRIVLADDLVAGDARPEEPEAIRLAEGLAIAAGIRRAIPPLHCAQVADLAARTANGLGLPDAVVLRCRLGGWLHDIGKLAIPDSVLRRVDAGPLSAEDHALFRRHAEVGAAIVAGIGQVAEAADAVRHHHERYDGGGYPAGLRGEDIPIEARVVAAANLYASLTNGGARRPGIDQAAALVALRAESGAALDPAVVASLVRAIGGRDTRAVA